VRVSRLAYGVWSRQRAKIDAFWGAQVRGDADACTLGYQGRTIIAWGAAKFSSRFPHDAVRRGAVRAFGRHLVLRTNEFNTSKRCKACPDTDLGLLIEPSYNRQRGLPSGANLHSLRRCPHHQCAASVDRDANAGCNIRNTLVSALLRGDAIPGHHHHRQREAVRSHHLADSARPGRNASARVHRQDS
jgi:hypothetical protein